MSDDAPAVHRARLVELNSQARAAVVLLDVVTVLGCGVGAVFGGTGFAVGLAAGVLAFVAEYRIRTLPSARRALAP